MSNNAETINKMLQNHAEKSNIEKVRAEVDAAYEKGPSWIHEVLPRERVHEFLAPRFKRKHGQCQYNRRKPNSNFSAKGHHVIRIAPTIITSEHDWQDTVRHELAHALAYEKWGSSQKHNSNWKRVCREIGAKPTRCASKKHTERPYRFACPDGCWEVGRLKRSKKIKRPWKRLCSSCGKPCVSWDAGDEMPEEPGVCEVSSIGWRTRNEYNRKRNL